mgnify:CR=1 FL=1
MTKEETAVDEVAERPENNTEAERKPRKKVKLAVEPAGSPDAPSAEKPVEKASEPKPTAKGRGDSAPGNSDGESDDAGNQDDDGDDDNNSSNPETPETPEETNDLVRLTDGADLYDSTGGDDTVRGLDGDDTQLVDVSSHLSNGRTSKNRAVVTG